MWFLGVRVGDLYKRLELAFELSKGVLSLCSALNYNQLQIRVRCANFTDFTLFPNLENPSEHRLEWRKGVRGSMCNRQQIVANRPSSGKL